MSYCPECGHENTSADKYCWECRQPLEFKAQEATDVDEDWLADDDDDVSPLKTPGTATTSQFDSQQVGSDQLAAETEALKHSPKDLEGHGVAYTAQDEVQAGAISQLLADYGIQNFSNPVKDSDAPLTVHVPEEDLVTAKNIIKDFTSMFDELEGEA